MAIDANDPRRGSFATGSSRQTADAAKQSANKARASSPSLSRSTPARSKSTAASKTVSRASAPTNQAFGDRASKPSGEQGAKKTQSRTGFPSGKADSGTPAMFDASKQRFAQQPSLNSFRPVPRPAERGAQVSTSAFRPIPRPTTQIAPTPALRPVPRPAQTTAQQYLDGPRTSMPVAQQYLDGPRTADLQQEAMADAFFARLADQRLGQYPKPANPAQEREMMAPFGDLELRADRARQGREFSDRLAERPLGQYPAAPDPAQERDRMRQFGNLELRADMDPYLANDPVARLGFDPDRIDYFAPRGKLSAFYTPDGADMLNMIASRESALRFNEMYPENRYQVPADTIMMTPFYPPATLAHESRHRGIQMLRNDPNATIPALSYRPNVPLSEEGIVEIGDAPYLDEFQPTPRGTIAFEQGWSPVSVRSTLDEGDPTGMGHLEIGQVRQGIFDQIQDQAADALQRRGEVPRATMQGSPRRAARDMRGINRDMAAGQQSRGLFGGGIGGLFGRIFGR